MADLKQEEEKGGEEKDEEVLKTQTFLSYARMATEFGTIQVKLLSEKGCDDNINGWYRVSEFKPSEDDELAEKSKTWNYAVRLVPVQGLTDEKDGPNSSKENHGCEIIVLRKTQRGQLGFELPRSGVVHISEAIDDGDDEKRLEESFPIPSSTGRRSRFARIVSSDDFKSSKGDIRWSSGYDTERSDSYLNMYLGRTSRILRSPAHSRESRIHASTNLGSLSAAQPIPPSAVAFDIQSTRESYLATVQQRDEEGEHKLSCDQVLAYRQSLQRKSTVRYSSTGEKKYNKIFPKSAPIKYNKSALPDSELFGDESDGTITIPPIKTSYPTSILEEQDKPYKELLDDPSMSSNTGSNKIKHSKKFGYTKSFIDEPRESEGSDFNDKAKKEHETKIEMTNTWKEISWDEGRLDEDSHSYIELDAGSITSVKDLRSENELEIVVYSLESEKSAQSEVVSVSPSNSAEKAPPLRYVAIPKQKIQDFLTKGIGAKRQSESDDGTKVKEICVKRKP